MFYQKASSQSKQINSEETTLTNDGTDINYIQTDGSWHNEWEDDIDTEHWGNAHPFGSMFNLINTTVGSGIVALPKAIQDGGIILGPLLLIFVGLLATYSLHLLIKSADKFRKFSYKDLAMRSIGKYSGIIFELTIIFLTFGVMTVFIVILSTTIPNLVKSLLMTIADPIPHEIEFLYNKWFVVGVFMVLIVFPLSVLKKIQFLSYTSTAAMIAIIYMIILIIVRMFVRIATEGVPINRIVWFNYEDPLAIINSIPTYLFAFGSHITLLPLYKDLRGRSTKKMQGVVVIGMGIVVLMYFLTGISGYLLLVGKGTEKTTSSLVFETFSQNVTNSTKIPDNILNALNDDPFVVIAKILIALVVMLSYPLLSFACREGVINIISPKKDVNLVVWIIITVFICGLTFVLGCLVDKITLVFGIVMTTGGILVSFIYPGIIFFLISPLWEKIISGVFMVVSGVLGLVCFVLAMIETVIGVIDLFK